MGVRTFGGATWSLEPAHLMEDKKQQASVNEMSMMTLCAEGNWLKFQRLQRS